MFEIINLFEELMNAKEIKKIELVIEHGEIKSYPGVKVWFDDSVKTYSFTDQSELDKFVNELNFIIKET